MASQTERQYTLFQTVPFTATAVASAGTTMTCTPGIAKVIVRPAGGAITVKVSGSTAAFAVADGAWSPEILYDPDGSTSQTFTLIGSNIACTGLAYFITDIGTTAAVAAP